MHHVIFSALSVTVCLIEQVIMDVSCDGPSLLSPQPSGQLKFCSGMCCVVTEPKLLVGTILQSWRQWARTPGLFHALLQALQYLLRDDHPYRDFNAMQFNRVGLVDALLHFCKVLYITVSAVCGWLI